MSRKTESAFIGMMSAVLLIIIIIVFSSAHSKPASAVVNKTPPTPLQYSGRSGDGDYYYIQISTPDGAVNCIQATSYAKGTNAGLSCNWEQFNAAHQPETK